MCIDVCLCSSSTLGVTDGSADSTQYLILEYHCGSSVRSALRVGSSTFQEIWSLPSPGPNAGLWFPMKFELNLHSQGSKSIATTGIPTFSTFAALSATAPVGRLQAVRTSIDLNAAVCPKSGQAMIPSWWWVAGHCLLGASLHHVGTSLISLIFSIIDILTFY